MTEKRKDYLSPLTKVMKVQQTEIICGSKDGTFVLSNSGKIEEGNENAWQTTDLTW